MAQRAFAMDDAVAILSRTPATVDALLRGLPDEWTHASEGGDTWSPYDVVGHLIHADLTNWLPRARVILAHGESRAFDDFDRVGQNARARGRSVGELLDEFAAVRRDSLRQLAALVLTEADLDRRGQHPALGVVTLRQLLSTWVVHDLDHVMQITRVLGKQYSDAVGPWRAYLRII